MSLQRLLPLICRLIFVSLLAIVFAQVEIQIEGSAGWGASLPTWRIENHWLLDVFWGGRAMTGYHAWVFPWIALFFHWPLLHLPRPTWRDEAGVIAAIIQFWIIEDAMWFVMNPGFGWQALNPAVAHWHKHWLWGLPVEYWGGTLVMLGLLWYSQRRILHTDAPPA